MPRVTVSAKYPIVPRVCVCCGGAPDGHITAVATRWTKRGHFSPDQRGFDFPICTGCRAHERILGSSPRRAECQGGASPVVFERWHSTELTFRFDSQRFADAFADANRAAGKHVWADRGGASSGAVGVFLWALIIIPVGACALLMLFASLARLGGSPPPLTGPATLTPQELAAYAAVHADAGAAARSHAHHDAGARPRATHRRAH